MLEQEPNEPMSFNRFADLCTHYDRIIQELASEQIDSWQEYTLLKIDRADVEPIYLLNKNSQSFMKICKDSAPVISVNNQLLVHQSSHPPASPPGNQFPV
jgi:hypothetical protein